MLCTAVNKIDKTLLRNAESTKLNPAFWIINPPENVISQSPEYWIIVGDTITLMNQSQIDTVDLPRFKEHKLYQLDNWLENQLETTTTFVYNSNSYTFKFSEETNNRLIYLYTFSNAAVNTNFAAANKTYAFYDDIGVVRNLNAVAIANVFARYGTSRLVIINTYLQKKEAIRVAASKNDLAAIII